MSPPLALGEPVWTLFCVVTEERQRAWHAGGMDDKPALEHRRPSGVTDATVEALVYLSWALDHVEQARGQLYAFHRLCGSAESAFEQAVLKLRAAGHDDIARELEEAVVGRNPLPGMWSFQMVEAYDDGYYTDTVSIHQRALDRLAEGRRHLYEAETKERLRTRGRAGHEATPSDADGRR